MPLYAGLLKPLDAVNHTDGADSSTTSNADVPPPAEVQHMPASDDIAVPQTPGTPESTAQVRAYSTKVAVHMHALAERASYATDVKCSTLSGE